METVEQEIARLERVVENITRELKAPGMTSTERIIMHEERKDCRKRLAFLREPVR